MIDHLASTAVSTLLDLIAARAAEELPGIGVERRDTADGGAVVLTGPGIVLRRITDARLRALAAVAARGTTWA